MAHRQRAKAKTKGPRAPGDEQMENALMEGLLSGMFGQSNAQHMQDAIVAKEEGPPTLTHNQHKIKYSGSIKDTEWGKALFEAIQNRGCFNISPKKIDEAALADLEDVGILDFRGEQGVNDYVIARLITLTDKLQNVHTLDLSGCIHVTDSGAAYLAELLLKLPHLREVRLNGCLRLTDRAMTIFGQAWHELDVEVQMAATSIAFFPRYIAHSKLRFHLDGCPLLCIKQNEEADDLAYSVASVAICPLCQDKSADSVSLFHLLTDGRQQQRQTVEFTNSAKLGSQSLSILSSHPQHPAFNFIPHDVNTVIIPVPLATEKEIIKKHMLSTMNHFLSKEVPVPVEKTWRPSYFHNFTVSCADLDTSSGILSVYSANSQHGAEDVFSPNLIANQEFCRSRRVFELEYMGGMNQDIGTFLFMVKQFQGDLRINIEKKSLFRFGTKIKPGDRVSIELVSNLRSQYIEIGANVILVYKKNGQIVHSVKLIYSSELYPAMVAGSPGTLWRIAYFWATDTSDLEGAVHHTGFQCNVIVDQEGFVCVCDPDELDEPGVWGSLNAVVPTYNSFRVEILETGSEGAPPVWLGVHNEVMESEDDHLHRLAVGYDGRDMSEEYEVEGHLNASPHQKGDVIEVKVTGIKGKVIENADTITVTFIKNGDTIGECVWTYPLSRFPHRLPFPRLVFRLVLHGNQQVRILNYKPQANPNVINEENTRFLMKGKTEDVLFDNGMLSTKNEPGSFIGCCSLTELQNAFSCKLIGPGVREFRLGLCYEQQVGNIDGCQGSSIWPEHAHKNDPPSCEVGDVICCGFDTASLKFAKNGIPTCNQNISIYVTKNGREVWRRELWYRGGGLIPAVQCPPRSQVALLDACIQNPLSFGSKFLIVGASAESKHEEHLTKLSSVLTEVKEILEKPDDIQKILRENDNESFFLQLRLKQLDIMHRNKTRLLTDWLDRVTCVCVDPQSDQDIMKLKSKVREAGFHSYKLTAGQRHNTSLIRALGEHEMLENTADLIVKHKMAASMPACSRLLREMSGWMQVIFIEDMDFPFAVTSVDGFMSILQKLYDEPTGKSDWTVKCLTLNTPIWGEKQLDDLFSDLSQGKKDLLLRMLMEKHILLRLTCHRKSSSDDRFIYVLPSHLQPIAADIKLTLLTPGGDLHVTSAVYHMPTAGLMPHVVHNMIALFARLCTPTFVWNCGIHFYQGSVEVILVADLEADSPSITLFSRTFMPTDIEGSKRHLQENVWSVFSIYHRVLQYVLFSHQVVLEHVTCTNTANGEVPLCSKHCWQREPSSDDLPRDKAPLSVCSVCHCCSERGLACEHSGLPTPIAGVCGCQTQIPTCVNCGVCSSCATLLWHIKSEIEPNTDNLTLTQTGDVRRLSQFSPDVALCNQYDVVIGDDLDKEISIVLKSVEDNRVVTVFPGPPHFDHGSSDYGAVSRGDRFTLRFTDLKIPPSRSFMSTSQQFAYHQCVDAQLWQDTGIVHGNAVSSVAVGFLTSKNLVTAINNYFEIEILHASDECRLGIGLVDLKFDYEKPLIDLQVSTIVYSSQGRVQHAANLLVDNLERFANHDRIGCGVELPSSPDTDKAVVYFTHNQKKVHSFEYAVPDTGARGAIWLGPHDSLRLIEAPTSVWRSAESSDIVQQEDVDQKPPELKEFYNDEIVKISPKTTLEFERNPVDQSDDHELILKVKDGRDDRIVVRTTIYIENISKQPVLFKVKVTNPKRYLVRPNSGTLNVREHRTVDVIINCEPNETISKDKFMVQYGMVDSVPATFDQIPNSKVKNCKLLCDWKDSGESGASIKKKELKILRSVRYGPPVEPSYCLAVLHNSAVISCDWIPKTSWVILVSEVKGNELVQSSQHSRKPLIIAPKMPSLSGMDCSHESFVAAFTVQQVKQTMMARKVKFLRQNMKEHPLVYRNFEFSFFPRSLTTTNLLYPTSLHLFDLDTLSAHRICVPPNLLHTLPSGNLVGHLPHLVDQDPLHFKAHMTAADIFTCQRVAKVYLALSQTKLLLPVHGLMLSKVSKDVPQFVVESSMQNILSIYASLCSLISQHLGGVDNMDIGAAQYDKWVSEYNSKHNTKSASSPNHTADGFTSAGLCSTHSQLFSPDGVPDSVEPSKDNITSYGPYSSVVNIYETYRAIEKLPVGFCENFSNLEVLKISQATKLLELPEDIQKMSELKVVCLKPGSVVATLPPTLCHNEQLEDLTLPDSHMTTLPSDLYQLDKLMHLTLHTALLSALPPAICDLHSLTFLDISMNPLISLPAGFGNLRNLKVLKLSGVPWLVGDGHFGNKVHPGFTSSSGVVHQNYPQLCKVLGEKTLDDLFRQCDGDSDGCLDEKELADLNARLYYMVPRLGLDYEDWDEYGGVPVEIFSLPQLTELHLDHSDIRSIPSCISNLTRLQALHLNHCMSLQSLPGDLGQMQHLNTLKLRHCPSLRTPPQEIVNKGTEACMAYLKRLSSGFTENWRTKLMLVGLGGAGKTSLLKALMSGTHKTPLTQGEAITDGIDISSWTVKHNEYQLTYSAWDFAGQTVYYNTHQFFLSSRAVYLLLWTTRLGYEHAGLDFWLSSIKCHAPHAPIFVIGTHCDQVSKAELPQQKLMQQYPQICGFHFVSCITGQGVLNLEEDLLETTLQQSYMGERIPSVYLSLEKEIIRARKETSVLPWERVKNFGLNIGIFDESDTKRAVNFLHDLGTVQYFDNEFLRDRVVINPQWIVDVMACVVSVKNSPIMDGRFYHRDIAGVWGQYPVDLHEWLLRLTEEFDLTFPLPNEAEPVNIVPCLLSESVPELAWPPIEPGSSVRETLMVYRFTYLPAGLFNRAQVRLFQFSDGNKIWKRGSLLKKNEHLAVIRQESDKTLTVCVQGSQPENVLFLIHEVFESLIEESFQGVTYNYQIPCPDCIKKVGGKDPAMFGSSLIREAAEWNAPFLQCRKFFHTVSMPYLQAFMPPDSSSDLDTHLAHDLQQLDQIRTDQSVDVFISYCPADVPTSTQTNSAVHPTQIRDDLQVAGIKCWFREDMADLDIHDVTIALQDSKIVLVCVSNAYEKDDRCRTLFLHAKEVLNKACVIVVLGRDMEWQHTHMGMVIGPQEVFVSMSNKARYPTKIVELKNRLQTMLQSNKTVAENGTKCFISYCWSNSHDAIKKGSRSLPGSLGWADPRQIKDFLEENGIRCWVDVEQTGKSGLFADITDGLRQAEVVVICASNEYARSKNCMMEMRFALITMNKPVVMAIVGTGDTWEQSEIGVLMNRSRLTKVNFQEENKAAHQNLLRHVKERLEKANKEPKPENITSQPQDNSVSFQEGYELAQRKFMRQISLVASRMDTAPYPRLCVLDYQSEADTVSHHYSHTPDDQRSTNQKTEDDAARDWLKQKFCFKLLCEHESGWHCSEEVIPAVTLTSEGEDTHLALSGVAAYLYRLYALLRHSSISLACQHGDAPSDQYNDFIKNAAAGDSMEIQKAYCKLREMVMKADHHKTRANLARCHLPSGKIVWLCKKHQKGSRIAVLTSEVAIGNTAASVIHKEDILMREFLEKHEEMRNRYRHRKPPGPTDMQKRPLAGMKRASTKKTVTYQPYNSAVAPFTPDQVQASKPSTTPNPTRPKPAKQLRIREGADVIDQSDDPDSGPTNESADHVPPPTQKPRGRFGGVGGGREMASMVGMHRRNSQACTIL